MSHSLVLFLAQGGTWPTLKPLNPLHILINADNVNFFLMKCSLLHCDVIYFLDCTYNHRFSILYMLKWLKIMSGPYPISYIYQCVDVMQTVLLQA